MNVTTYDPETGRLLKVISCPERLLERMTAGAPYYPAPLDLKRQRIDLATGEPVEDDFEQQDRIARAARYRVMELEANQMRAMRELLLDPSNAEARSVLRGIDDEIAQLRPRIAGGNPDRRQ